jgi:hypothetical protein
MKINNDAFIKAYNATGKGTSNKISCTKCDASVTAFGSNLEGKIKKAGGLEILLDTFVCRNCKSAAAPKKVFKERVRKVTKKDKAEELKKYDIPAFKISIPRNVYLKDAKDIQESMSSSGICLSPSYYLDHAKQCEGCAFYSSCQCALKKAA